MKKIMIVSALVALMAAAATYGFAQNPGSPPGQRRIAAREWGLRENLSLTPDQRAKLQELHRKFNDETAQLRGSLLTKRLELRSLWTNPKADPKAITEKQKELWDVQAQLRDKAFQMRLEARNILTPEQLARIGTGRSPGHHPGRPFTMNRGQMGCNHPARGWGRR